MENVSTGVDRSQPTLKIDGQEVKMGILRRDIGDILDAGG